MIAGMAIFLFTTVAGPASVMAQSGTDPTYAFVTGDDTNIYIAPNTRTMVIDVLPRNRVVEVLGRDTSSDWIYVRPLNEAIDGWLPLAALLMVDDIDISSLPVIEIDPAVWLPFTAPIHADVSNATLYAQPTLTANVIAIVEAATTVDVIGRNASGSWLAVAIDEQMGWLVITTLDIDDDYLAEWQEWPVIDASSSVNPAEEMPLELDPTSLRYIQPTRSSVIWPP